MGIEDVVNGTVMEISPAPPEPAPQPEAIAEAIEPTPEPAPEVAPEVVVEEPKHIPLPVFLDMRDKSKEAERRAVEAERRLAEIEAAKTPQNVPDPLDDPQGHHEYLQREMGTALIAQKFEMSKVMAEQQHGADVVEAALEWAKVRAANDPTFVQAYMQSPHPIDVVVRQHKRDSLVSQLPSDVSTLDELVEREIAKRGLSATAAAPAVVAPQQAPVTPARSLASQPSSGGAIKDVPTGPLAALGAIFPA